MEKFWAVILIFVVVAAAGLIYVNQVYIPQKDTQMAMAETANQTLTAVKAEMDNNEIPIVVNSNNVVQTVMFYCKSGNTVNVTVDGKGYLENADGIEGQVESSRYYTKTTKRVNGVITEIKFTKA